MFSRLDLPAPEGPITAVNSPGLKCPETPLRMDFVSENEKKNI
jgi:hypothetical protein